MSSMKCGVTPSPTVCQAEEFIGLIPGPRRMQKNYLLRLSREGKWPSYKRIESRQSPAWFNRQEIVDHFKKLYWRDFPHSVIAVAKALIPKKKVTAPSKKRGDKKADAHGYAQTK